MSGLGREAREQIKASGITIAAYIRDQKPDSGKDGRTWTGDSCGCFDDRCAGYHHDEDEECGCLRVLLGETVERLSASLTTSTCTPAGH